MHCLYNMSHFKSPTFQISVLKMRVIVFSGLRHPSVPLISKSHLVIRFATNLFEWAYHGLLFNLTVYPPLLTISTPIRLCMLPFCSSRPIFQQFSPQAMNIALRYVPLVLRRGAVTKPLSNLG